MYRYELCAGVGLATAGVDVVVRCLCGWFPGFVVFGFLCGIHKSAVVKGKGGSGGGEYRVPLLSLFVGSSVS